MLGVTTAGCSTTIAASAPRPVQWNAPAAGSRCVATTPTNDRGQRMSAMTSNREPAPEVYTTKELSTRTWPEFERLFSQGGGWDFCACMLTQRGCHLSEREFPTRAEREIRNHREKQQLVDQGRAHGILVDIGAEPVGRCEYGPVEELPIPGLAGPDRRNILRACDSTSQWRIPCFVTHKKHCGRGVASTALAAALDSSGAWAADGSRPHPSPWPTNI
jgi:hypothetical protein